MHAGFEIERDDPWCDPMPAFEHGYFERAVLALRDGSLFAGGASAPGGWFSDTYLLRADRQAEEARRRRSRTPQIREQSD